MVADELNYHHLRLFRAVVRAGSVAAAARSLHLTPQTVSEQVRNLEQAMGASLVDRSGRSVRPTETGRLVAAYADEIFDRGRTLLEVVRQRESARPLQVTVGRNAGDGIVEFSERRDREKHEMSVADAVARCREILGK